MAKSIGTTYVDMVARMDNFNKPLQKAVKKLDQFVGQHLSDSLAPHTRTHGRAHKRFTLLVPRLVCRVHTTHFVTIAGAGSKLRGGSHFGR